MRPDYYQNEAAVIETDGFDLNQTLQFDMLNYTSPTTLKLNKLDDSYSTFDDGLLFQFPL